MKDRKNMIMVVIIGITISLFLCFNTTVFATTGTVITSDLRLRKEGSTESQILTLLDENDEVEILSEEGDWYKVKANEKIGYVSKQYIKVKENNVILNETNGQTNNETNNTTTENQNTENQNTENQNPQETTNIVEQPKEGTISSESQIRIIPLINGSVINTAKSGEKYEIISNVGLWSYIKNNEKEGWILTEKLSTTQKNDQQQNQTTNQPTTEQKQENENKEPQKEETTVEKTTTEKTYAKAKTYYVKGTSVNVRSQASKTSDVITSLNTNKQLKVTGEDGNWYIVEINGKKGYILKTLLSSKKVETTSRSSSTVTKNQQTQNNNATTQTQNTQVQTENKTPAKTEEPAKATTSSSGTSGDAVVAYAKKFLGYRYVYGTNGPNTFDCSGFVQYVYKHFGYSLSRSSKTQAKDGVAVSKSNLQPGDILIFKNTAKTQIGHVGIYIGNNQFIHASNSRTGVIISSLSTSSYQQRYVTARRVL